MFAQVNPGQINDRNVWYLTEFWSLMYNILPNVIFVFMVFRKLSKLIAPSIRAVAIFVHTWVRTCSSRLTEGVLLLYLSCLVPRDFQRLVNTAWWMRKDLLGVGVERALRLPVVQNKRMLDWGSLCMVTFPMNGWISQTSSSDEVMFHTWITSPQ